eukprot:TRINITY_DN10457_c0_g1_i2.p1 TRINITY_DN10457_c0_g1~~TRINITY_DN10457_c0_g1_i2.p1  ORF type:complete len:267 (+),score=59.45 TRINITY_DN10457_c0_g1_i2:63-863(+)
MCIRDSIKRTLLFAALCHTIIVEGEGDKTKYNASSPDELALVNWAKYCGYVYKGLDDENYMVVSIGEEVKRFKLLHVLEFTSARKRMSVIIQEEGSDEIKLFCKGADSIIFERLNSDDKENQELQDPTNQALNDYGNIGLRTLVFAERAIPKEEYLEWERSYQEASKVIESRDEKIAEIEDKIEKDLIIVAASAIEDKLQDEVEDTIQCLKEAGIKFWILTGDKVETAINIGTSCKLLEEEMDIQIIDGKDKNIIQRKLDEAYQKY